jgi:hypothetical protein
MDLANYRHPSKAAQNDRSSPGTDSFTRKLPHWRGMVLHRGRGERMLWDGLVKETAKYSVFAGCSWLLSDHRLVAKAEVFRGKCRQPGCSWPGLSAKTASSTRRGGSHLARGNVQFRLDGRRASFEASLREAPQDEENFLMPSRTSLMLRRRAAPSRSAPGVDATSN